MGSARGPLYALMRLSEARIPHSRRIPLQLSQRRVNTG